MAADEQRAARAAGSAAPASPTPRYERFFDRAFGVRGKGPRIPRGVAMTVICVVATLMKLLFRCKVSKRENLVGLARESGVVVVSNHSALLDVVMMFMSAWPRVWPRLIGRSTLFEGRPVFGWLLARLGVIPIKRGEADLKAIKRAARSLRNGEVIMILPEGTRRSRGSQVPEVHGGAAMLARMAKVPILPMTVRDAENVRPEGARGLRFPRITSEFGDPVLLEDFDFLPRDQRLEGCVWYALRESYALNRRVAPEDVDMVELFPGGYDFTPVFREHPIPRHTSEEVARRCATARQAAEAADAVEAVKSVEAAEGAVAAGTSGPEQG
ncbi:1-acyl-sn-glycerol-3-phosphate acyltransferase [Berryella wangjianweii]|uniref:1-acyl-sn-glycerol-3-phosphate acyltransferase n=1 Tax=Berryella wangjianweii TaxID=2734634 RepID=A0A6M8J4Z8_9ACTN|nr:lysophospholipid acyltransferase family protein [Berryella wangjianweii]NPD32465.1 1-acyl-sn-glycerol-3-phosphate acyltransferase [Eggerthellaceae bacterium zg-997]QKF06778.1 1-acyl-sn-glycerol-3-phosphate acyltransferase [Berryella wangjianweii]